MENKLKTGKFWPKGSNVKSARYNLKTSIIELEFGSGKVYEYLGIPLSVWDKCLEAESGTAFLNSELRNKYDFKLKPVKI